MSNDEGMTKDSVTRYLDTSLHPISRSTIQQFLCRRSLGERGNNLTWRRHSLFTARSAFTLIEMVVVIAIIVILAGLVLSTVGYVQKKAARSRAEAEIAAMSAACESYKADNGIYPTDASTTEQLDSTASFDPANYQSASLYLYKRLSGDTTGNRQPTGKSYFAFKPNMLDPADQNQPVQDIRDPFGNSYGYSTKMAATGSGGYNPTFDFWSTAGVAPSPTPAPPAAQQDLWIKNW